MSELPVENLNVESFAYTFSKQVRKVVEDYEGFYLESSFRQGEDLVDDPYFTTDMLLERAKGVEDAEALALLLGFMGRRSDLEEESSRHV